MLFNFRPHDLDDKVEHLQGLAANAAVANAGPAALSDKILSDAKS